MRTPLRPPLATKLAARLLALALLPLGALAAEPQAAPGSMPGTMNVRWNAGAPDCTKAAEPAVQVHAYNATTYVLRESLCVTSEAPFVYLLIGADRALLIDSGEAPAAAPLAREVVALLPVTAGGRMPLLVVHSQASHAAGDARFVALPRVEVVGASLSSVRRYFGLTGWPEGQATIDLGGRVVDVLPAPGPGEAGLVFYDHATALMFTGDFLLPGRLTVDNAAADAASARRIADFSEGRPLAYVLGARIGMNLDGQLYTAGARWHPAERPLQLSRTELEALPGVVGGFRGVYARRGGFTLINRAYERDLVVAALAIAVVVLMAGFAALVVRARRWLAKMKTVRLAAFLPKAAANRGDVQTV